MDEKYLPELMAEKDSLDPSFTHALRLVNQGEGRRGTAGRSGAPCPAVETGRSERRLPRVLGRRFTLPYCSAWKGLLCSGF